MHHLTVYSGRDHKEVVRCLSTVRTDCPGTTIKPLHFGNEFSLDCGPAADGKIEQIAVKAHRHRRW